MLREKYRNCVVSPGLKEDQQFNSVFVLCTCTCSVCWGEKLSVWVIKGLGLRIHRFYEETSS